MVRDPSQAEINEKYEKMQRGLLGWTEAVGTGLAAGLSYDLIDERLREGEQTAERLFRLVHGDPRENPKKRG